MAISVRPYFGQAGLAVPNYPAAQPAATGLGIAAKGLDIAAQVTDRLADEQADREVSDALLKARTDFTGFLDGLKKRQDYNKFGQDWQTTADEWKSQNLQGLSTRGRQKLGTRIDELIAGVGEKVRGEAWSTQVDVSRADLSRFLDDSFKLIGKDPNGGLAHDTMTGIAERIDSAEGAGFLTATQAEAMRQETKGRYGIVAASSLIDQDPYGAKKALAGGQFDQYLTPEKKLQLQDAADREIKRREAEARARAAEANALWLDGFKDTIASLEDGNPLPADSPYIRETLVSRLGAEKGGKLADALDYAVAFGGNLSTLKTASAEERAAILAREASDLSSVDGYQRNKAELQALQDAAKSIETALATDPARYVIQNVPAVEAAYNDMVDTMQSPTGDQQTAAKRYAAVAQAEIERLTGKPATNWLPASYLGAVSQQFSSQPEGGEDAAQVVSGLQDLWGRQWPDVYRQLVQAEAIPPEAVMIGSGMAEGPAARLAEVSRVPLDELKKGLADSDTRDVRVDAGEALEDFRKVTQQYVGGEKQFSAAYSAVERLALSYMRDGQDAGDAVDRAYNEVIGSRYEFYGSYFVPKEQDPDAVSSGAAAMQDKIEAVAGSLDVPTDIQGVSDDARRAAYLSTLAAGGYWVTSPEQDGLTFMDPTGSAVTIGGKPLRLTWDQLRDDPAGQIERTLRDAGFR